MFLIKVVRKDLDIRPLKHYTRFYEENKEKLIEEILHQVNNRHLLARAGAVKKRKSCLRSHHKYPDNFGRGKKEAKEDIKISYFESGSIIHSKKPFDMLN